MDIQAILLETKHLLEDKYDKEPRIDLQRKRVMLESPSRPDTPVHPDEVNEIVIKVMQKFNLAQGSMASSVLSNGSIIISLSD